MASGTNYSQEYGQAEKAYLQGDFSQAVAIIDRLVEEFPDNPNILLLRGHIYCYGFNNYDLAAEQYQAVLELSQERDLLDFARNGIQQVQQLQNHSEKLQTSDRDLELDDFEEGFGDTSAGHYDFELDADFTPEDSNLDPFAMDEAEDLEGTPEFDTDSDYDDEDPFSQFDSSELESENYIPPGEFDDQFPPHQ